MGPAGASFHKDGPGNVDHILWVTMTADGPASRRSLWMASMTAEAETSRSKRCMIAPHKRISDVARLRRSAP